MRRDLLSPRLVALHLLVLAVLLVLVRLGVWQVSRLGEAQQRVADQQERLAADAVPVTDVLAGLTLDDTAALADREFLPVTATGTWRPGDEVLQRRSLDGRAGFHVLTPLDLAEGGTLLVRRGWVPFDNDLRPPVPRMAPPRGEVTISGTLERSIPQPTGPVAQRDPDEGELEIVFNADIERLAPQLASGAAPPDSVLPMLVRLEDSVPAAVGEQPVLVPPPDGDTGPHLSYAIQWFAFALIGASMYGVWLARRARGDERAVSRDGVSGPAGRR